VSFDQEEDLIKERALLSSGQSFETTYYSFITPPRTWHGIGVRRFIEEAESMELEPLRKSKFNLDLGLSPQEVEKKN